MPISWSQSRIDAVCGQLASPTQLIFRDRDRSVSHGDAPVDPFDAEALARKDILDKSGSTVYVPFAIAAATDGIGLSVDSFTEARPWVHSDWHQLARHWYPVDRQPFRSTRIDPQGGCFHAMPRGRPDERVRDQRRRRTHMCLVYRQSLKGHVHGVGCIHQPVHGFLADEADDGELVPEGIEMERPSGRRMCGARAPGTVEGM